MKRILKSKTNLALATACLTMAFLPTVRANQVTDGGFENPVNTGSFTLYGPGTMGAWTVSVGGNNPGIYNAGSFAGANVTEGTQAFNLGLSGYASGNSISQLLSTVAGQSYQISFDWGSEYAAGVTAFVSVGDLNQTLIDPVRYGNLYDTTPWIVHSSIFSFTASGNDTLTFGEAAGSPSDFFGLTLDNIVVATPEPSTLSLLLLPLGAAMLRKLRKHD